MDFERQWSRVFSIAQVILRLLAFFSTFIESLMFRLMEWYDLYCYSPLQKHLSPVMARIPRFIRFQDRTITVFNANIVTYSRTLLIVPIAWALKYEYSVIGCLLVVLHDFLDHVDGIVAKVHKRLYGENIDDPIFGGFLDAFCDKIVNVFSLWTILQETNFQETSFTTSLAFVLLCYTIIGLETAIGIVRLQDYFHAASEKKKGASSTQGSTAAAMEGKLKEKLESMGLAFLCLSTRSTRPFHHWAGVSGIVCFALTIRLAYASLMKKLQARKAKDIRPKMKIHFSEDIHSPPTSPIQKTIAIIDANRATSPSPMTKLTTTTTTRQRAFTVDSVERKGEKRTRTDDSMNRSTPAGSTSSIVSNRTADTSNSKESIPQHFHFGAVEDEMNEEEHRRPPLARSASLPTIWIDGRADKVYTVGCFDLFHEGHRLLLLRMRQFGREVIVGVHDSRSIFKLKSRVPIDGTEKRMINVKTYADQVYCVAATDPAAFVTCIVHLKEDETAIYVRGDDMADFPSRHVVEELMPVRFLPYTNGISSTKLRQELFSHIQHDDLDYLEKVN